MRSAACGLVPMRHPLNSPKILQCTCFRAVSEFQTRYVTCVTQTFFDPLREDTRTASLLSPSGRQYPHCATLAPVETTTATQAFHASCDSSPSGNTQRAECAPSRYPCGLSEYTMRVALSLCGLFDSCCGIRHVRCFQSPCGFFYLSAAQHAKCVGF